MQVNGAAAINAEAVTTPIGCRGNISLPKMDPIGNASIQATVAALKNAPRARITGTNMAKTIGLKVIAIDHINKSLLMV